jgi:hypothetical protein
LVNTIIKSYFITTKTMYSGENRRENFLSLNLSGKKEKSKITKNIYQPEQRTGGDYIHEPLV